MKKSIIPWHVFLDAVTAQSASSFKTWIRRWRFTDTGVVLVEAGDMAAPEPSGMDTKTELAQTTSMKPALVDATKSLPQPFTAKLTNLAGIDPSIGDSFREL